MRTGQEGERGFGDGMRKPLLGGESGGYNTIGSEREGSRT